MSEDRCELLCLDLAKAEGLRRGRLRTDRAEEFGVSFKALADPTRLMLAVALAEGGELCVCDLSWIAERPENLVSHHLRHLHSAGLVGRHRQGKMVMYELNERGRELVGLALASSEVRA